MVTQVARRVFDRNQLVGTTVRVRNTGNTPTTLGVRVTAGSQTLVGFSQGANPVTIVTPRTVAPGETAEIRISVRLPDTPGDKSFRVEVGSTDLAGRLTRIFDAQDFPNLASVRGLEIAEAVTMLPLPGEPPVPAIPAALPVSLPMEFQEALGGAVVAITPSSVVQGEPFIGNFSIPTGASAPLSPELNILLLDSTLTVVRSLLVGRVTVQPGQTLSRGFNIQTRDLAPGGYFVEISLIDASGLVLFGPQTFPPVGLRVLALPMEEPVAISGFPPPPELEPFTPTPIPFIEPEAAPVERAPRIGEVFLSYQGSSPATPSRGSRVFLVFNIRNTGGGGGGTLNVQAFPKDSAGRNRGTLSTTVTIGPNSTTGFNLIIPEVAEDSPAGPWSIDVNVWDQRTFVAGNPSTFLIRQRTEPIFTLGTVAAPTPIGPALPTLISVVSPTLTPSTVAPGGTLTAAWTVRNPGATTLRVFLLLSGPGGARTSRDIGAGQQTTLRLTAQVPTTQPGGRVTYTLSIRDDRNQTISGLSATFSINVQAPTVPTAEPVALTPVLSLGFPRALPSIVNAGDSLTLQFFAIESANVSGSIRFSAFAQDPSGRTAGFGVTTATVNAGRATAISIPLRVNSTAMRGTYSVRISWVPTAGGTVIPTDFQGVFEVS